jgi:ribosome biogenesis protein BRX1
MAELYGCTLGLYFESRKKLLYVWALAFPSGPSIKFYVHGVHTSKDLNMTGNSILYSRPIVSFGPGFGDKPHMKLARELLM